MFTSCGSPYSHFTVGSSFIQWSFCNSCRVFIKPSSCFLFSRCFQQLSCLFNHVISVSSIAFTALPTGLLCLVTHLGQLFQVCQPLLGHQNHLWQPTMFLPAFLLDLKPTFLFSETFPVASNSFPCCSHVRQFRVAAPKWPSAHSPQLLLSLISLLRTRPNKGFHLPRIMFFTVSTVSIYPKIGWHVFLMLV